MKIRTRSSMKKAGHPLVIVMGDDQKSVSELISVLEKAHIEAGAVRNLKKFKEILPQAVVITEGAGGKGWDLSSQIRDESNVPILMVGSSNSELAWVKAAAYGIDCYLVKPFAYRELAARIKALVRRYDGSLLDSQKPHTHKVHV